jgi:hypothetical protein
VVYGVSTKMPIKDGAFARNLADGTTRTLMAGNGRYKDFAIDSKGAEMAFVSDRDDFKSAAPQFKLYYASASTPAASELALPANCRWSSVRTAVSSSQRTAAASTHRAAAARGVRLADLIKVDI